MSQKKILEKADREEELDNLRNWKLYAEGMYARTHHEKYKLTADNYQKQIDDILRTRKEVDELKKRAAQKYIDTMEDNSS